MTDTATVDIGAHYRVAGYPGIAFYLTGWNTEEVYEGDQIVCEDEECDHALSEMCWAQGDTSIVTSDTVVTAVMVGDDRVHLVDVSDLTVLPEDGYCMGCGQIGCGHNTSEETS